MRIAFLILFFLTTSGCFAEQGDLLIDDFEVVVSGGPDGTFDYGSGGGSSIKVSQAEDIKYSGKQSIKVDFDAVSGGYMWVARGFGLDARNTAWLVKTEDIDWQKYGALSFYMYGNNSGAMVAFDIKDSGNEMWRFIVTDNFKGWKKIVCPFAEFFVRGDWQPDNADKNANLDFPIKSFQFEPRPEARGQLYFDCVELVAKQ